MFEGITWQIDLICLLLTAGNKRGLVWDFNLRPFAPQGRIISLAVDGTTSNLMMMK